MNVKEVALEELLERSAQLQAGISQAQQELQVINQEMSERVRKYKESKQKE